MGCSITNIGECIVEFLFDFLIDMINGALQPFLNLVHKFLTEPVSIKVFAEPWSIIVYILSMFYGILLVYIGIRFITAGESPEHREKAKSSLRNIIIMMILIQASFLLYDLILGISASLTKAIIGMINTDFFIITLENYSNFGFELILSIIYLFFLIITLIILLLRYICVSAGLLFFTIGIFLPDRKKVVHVHHHKK